MGKAKRILGLVGIAMAILFSQGGCADIGQTVGGVFGNQENVKTTVTTGGPSVAEVNTYQGPKARIAVKSFEMKSAKGSREIGSGMSDMLVDALFRTNRFIVLERGEGLSGIKEEFELTKEGYTEKGKSAEKGGMEGADVLVTGSIVAFEPNAGGATEGGLVIPLPWKAGGGIVLKHNDAYIAATIRLIDVRTGRIINSTRVEGQASNYNVGLAGGVKIKNVILAGGFSKYKNTPMEKAVMIMLDNAVNEITKSIPQDYYRYTPQGNPPVEKVEKATTTQEKQEVKSEAEGIYCSQCGAKNDKDAKFCTKCGHPLKP